MAYIFFKNRGTEGKKRRNSNKNSKLRVPPTSWDSGGTKKAWDSSDAESRRAFAGYCKVVFRYFLTASSETSCEINPI